MEEGEGLGGASEGGGRPGDDAPSTGECTPGRRAAPYLLPTLATFTHSHAVPPPSYTQKRMNKQYQDAVLEVRGSSVALYDDEGKAFARGKAKGCGDMPEGSTGEVGGWEFEVDARVDAARFASGELFIGRCSAGGGVNAVRGGGAPPLALAGGLGGGCALGRGGPRPALRPHLAHVASAVGGPAALPAPLFSPDDPGALVLNPGRPGEVPVVVDPFLGRRLRDHQGEAVAFMYRCLSGHAVPGVAGCILAHAMARSGCGWAWAGVWA